MSSTPPPALRRLLTWLLPPGPVRDGLLGDLDELYADRVRMSRASADLWYARQLLSAAVHYPLRRVWARRTDGSGPGMMESLARDVVYALRTLRASPGFTAATVVTLGLGIGATLMLHGYGRWSRPGPTGLDAPERLLYLGEGPVACRRCVSMAGGDYAILRDQARSFERVSMFAEWEPTLRGSGGGELLDGLLVTPEIFSTLGVRPLLGRVFVSGDGVPGGDHVVVLGEAAWRRRLGGDSTVIGRTVLLDRMPYTVVGVVPNDLVFPHAGDRTEVWAPLAWTPGTASEETAPGQVRGLAQGGYQVVARLRDGATRAAASAEIAGLAARYASAPGAVGDATYLASPVLEDAGLGTAPSMLVAAVGLVLLIAWINLAGLLVARLSARRREFAVRRALGAGPGQIARQLLAEAALLAAFGSVFAVAVAAAGARSVLGSAQVIDVEGLRLVLVLGSISGVAVGAWPAIRFARPRRRHALAEMTRTATGGIDTARGRRALMVAEVALATVLLSAAGLLGRTFANIYRIEPGFSADGVLALRVWDPPPGSRDDSPSERVDRLVQALETVPGVVRGGGVLGLPFGGGAPVRGFEVEGRPAVRPADRPRARMQAVTPGYFAALEIPLRRGRGFDDGDGADAPPVAILNEAAALAFFPDQDPIGRAVLIDGARWEVVGVAGTVFDGDQEDPAFPEIYRPMRQWAQSTAWIALRIREDPTRLGPDVRAAVRAFDPDIAITRLSGMDALRAASMSSERRMLRLMAAFALAAVLMSAVGLYGLISYSVSQRTREFGVRTALGAPKGAVLGLVLGQGIRIAAAGAAIGIVGAVATLRVMRSLLFGVSPTDPLTLAGVVALVCGVSLLATFVPARRATRVDPMTSLSAE